MSEQEHVTKNKPHVKKKNNYNMHRVTLTPTENNLFHGYYDEYVMDCQQHHHRPPKFNAFMIAMAEEGFDTWRAKVGKK